MSAMPFLHAQQPLGRDGLIGALDLNQLRLTEGWLRLQPVARWTR